MQKEMESIYSNDVWDLVELLKDMKPVGSGYLRRKPKQMDRLSDAKLA